MSYFFIINPRAGLKYRDIEGRIRSFFTGRPHRIEFAYTEGRDHAAELSARAALAGFSRVVAAGGDGTIRETASALIGKPAALGILPCGSGNGLARNLYIPLDLDRSLAGLLSWEPRAVDAGLANGRPFFVSAGVGLDAEVAHDFNSGSGRRGIFPYIWHAARRIFSYQPAELTALVDGRRLELRGLVNAVLNGVQYGGGARMAPAALIDDGLLDLVSLRKPPLHKLLLYVPDLFRGTLDRRRDVYSSYKGRIIEFHCRGGAWYHLDGEDYYSHDGRLKFSALQGALKVLAPKPSLQGR